MGDDFSVLEGVTEYLRCRCPWCVELSAEIGRRFLLRLHGVVASHPAGDCLLTMELIASVAAVILATAHMSAATATDLGDSSKEDLTSVTNIMLDVDLSILGNITVLYNPSTL